MSLVREVYTEAYSNFVLGFLMSLVHVVALMFVCAWCYCCNVVERFGGCITDSEWDNTDAREGALTSRFTDQNDSTSGFTHRNDSSHPPVIASSSTSYLKPKVMDSLSGGDRPRRRPSV